MKKKVIYQITRHKISKIEITSEEEERAVAEANRDFERMINVISVIGSGILR